MGWPIVGSCPMCGAPIYNKPVELAVYNAKDKKKTVGTEPVHTVVFEDDLPKNFFTCSCRLGKVIHEQSL